jgi:hypothetical protein
MYQMILMNDSQLLHKNLNNLIFVLVYMSMEWQFLHLICVLHYK